MPDYGKIIFKEQDRTGVLKHLQNKFDGNWDHVLKSVESVGLEDSILISSSEDQVALLNWMIEMMDLMM